MQVVLFTNARNETHLREWAAHHLLLGFDKIIIFDHKSNPPIAQDFNNFDNRIKIINVSNMEGAIKMPLMNLAANLAKQMRASWMLYLDADEYVILNTPPQIKGIKQFLTTFKHVDQLAVNWLMYGSSHIVDELDINKGELQLEKYTHSEEHLNNHVKCFVRPQVIINANNPHFYLIQNPQTRNYGIDGRIFNPPFHDLTAPQMPFYRAPIYIAHYVFQSENTYKKRKLDLPRDDNGTMRTDSNISHIHGRFNNRINLLAATKYAPTVKEFLRAKNVIGPQQT